MKTDNQIAELIPPALLAEVEAMAAAERRPASDIVRAAVEDYLHSHARAASDAALASTPTEMQKRAAREAGERILARRKGNVLPEGVTIRDLQTYGRS